jgi:integrase/recombinase XerD
MASIFKRGTRPAWRISFFDDQGRRREISSHTTEKRAAERIAAKLEAEVALRRAGVIDAHQARLADENRRPFSDHVEDHLRHLSATERTKQTQKARRRYLRWLQEETGITRLTDLTPEAFEHARARLRAKGFSARTANTRLEAIRAFLNWCVKTGRLAANPLRTVSKLNDIADRRYLRRALTEEELRRLFDVAETEGRTLWYSLAFWAGIRRGELSRIRWGDVDFEAATLTIRRGKAKREDVIPLHPELVLALQRARPSKARPDAFILPQAVTNKTRIRDFERAKIPLVDGKGHHADLHSLRMTLHTMLAKGGVPPVVAQKLLRHSDYRTTIRHYYDFDAAEAGSALRTLPLLRRIQSPPAEPRQQERPHSEHGSAPSDAESCGAEEDGIEQRDEPKPLESGHFRGPVRRRAASRGSRARGRRRPAIGLGNRRSILLSYGRGCGEDSG